MSPERSPLAGRGSGRSGLSCLGRGIPPVFSRFFSSHLPFDANDVIIWMSRLNRAGRRGNVEREGAAVKVKGVVFSVLAALIPVWVYEGVQTALENQGSRWIVMLLAGVVSFLVMAVATMLLDALVSDLNKYCGQWVEELVRIDKGKREWYIGIGIIRYDHKSGEHTFIGKTYTLQGEERYVWNIDYLQPDTDNSMQYICGVRNPNEMSIGRLTFANRNEFEGNIWVMDGAQYKLHAYRITGRLLKSMEFTGRAGNFARRPGGLRQKVRQIDCPDFAVQYKEKVLKEDWAGAGAAV